MALEVSQPLIFTVFVLMCYTWYILTESGSNIVPGSSMYT